MREAPFLAVLITAVLAADRRCLQRAETDSANFVHDFDCRQYYKCQDKYQLIEEHCPDGLEFNPLLSKCDHPRGFCTPVTKKPVQHVMSCDGLADGSYYPDYSDSCRMFYHCSNGIPKVSKCADGMKFDEKTRKCLTENRVQCAYTPRSQPDCSKTSHSAHIENGCKSYTECDQQHRPIQKFCEGSLIFNERTKSCDWPQKTRCGGVDSRSDHLHFEDFDNKICKSKQNGFVVGPNRSTKCASYYACQNEQLTEHFCGHRLVFNSKIGVCDVPENVKHCDLNPRAAAAGSAIDCSKRHDIRFEHPDDCSAYVACQLGRANVHKCAKGQVFDKAGQACVDDLTNRCPKSKIASEYAEILAEPVKQKNEKKIASYPNYANGCRSYFDCKKTHCQERFCPSNLAFSAEKLSCESTDTIFCDTIDKIDGAENNHGSKLSGRINGRATPSYIDCSVKHGTWYEDRSDQTKFYVCVMGNAIHQQCHAGQVFDKVRHVCLGEDCVGPTVSPPPVTPPPVTPPPVTPPPVTPPPVTPPPVTPPPVTPPPVTPPGNGYCGKYPSGSLIPNGIYPERYYICENGHLREAFCNSGEEFNEVLGRCVPGVPSPTPTPTPTPRPPPPVLNCGQYPQGAFVPDLFNPNKYFICIMGMLRPYYCPIDQIFDQNLLMCIESGPRPPPPGSCGNYTEGTQLALYQNATQITKYYLVCYSGVFLVETCPDNMGYNERAGYCVIGGNGNGNQGMPCGPNFPDGSTQTIPDSVDRYKLCQNQNIIIVKCQPGQIFNGEYCENPCAFILNGDTTVQVPSIGNNYFKCTGGKLAATTTLPCPSGQTYYQALANTGNPCYTVPAATCPQGPSYVNVGIPETTLTPPTPTANFNLTAATRYYINCNGQTAPLVQRCYPGTVMLFGYEDQGCILITPVRRRSNNLLQIDVAEFDEKNKLCNGQTTGTYIPVKDDCQKFYVCLNSILVQHSCPDGQYFEIADRACRTNDQGQCASGENLSMTVAASENGIEQKDISVAGFDSDSSAQSGEISTVIDCFGKHGTFYADPKDCRRFYTCVNGWKIGQHCHYGEFYDQETHSCKMDFENTCNSKNDQILTNHHTNEIFKIPEETTDLTCVGRELGEFLPDTNDCTSYFICSKGLAIPKQCPASHYFDSITLICKPNDGTCGSIQDLIDPVVAPATTTKPLYLAPIDDTTICTGKHGIIVADHNDCRSFYLCVYGRAHHDHCYDGEYFDTRHRHCSANKGQCKSDVSKPFVGHGNGQNTQTNNICVSFADGTHLPDPDDCKRFVVCFDGIPVPERCGDDEFFDNIRGYCRKGLKGAQTCSQMMTEKNVCLGKHGVAVENLESCRKYYLCVNGQALLHDCNADEYFNVRTGSCVLDVDKKCTPQGEKQSIKETLRPPSSIPICPAGVNEFIFYPNVNDDCKSFYECANGKAIIHACPHGFIYNAVLNICDLPDFVECTHTMNIKDIRDPSCTGAISGVRYANYDNGCKSFYVCSHGTAVQTLCGEGLLYNPVMGVCDWAWNVNCLAGSGFIITPSPE